MCAYPKAIPWFDSIHWSILQEVIDEVVIDLHVRDEDSIGAVLVHPPLNLTRFRDPQEVPIVWHL